MVQAVAADVDDGGEGYLDLKVGRGNARDAGDGVSGQVSR